MPLFLQRQKGRPVGAHPEEAGVAERDQATVAEGQIEGGGEEREDQDPRQEIQVIGGVQATDPERGQEQDRRRIHEEDPEPKNRPGPDAPPTWIVDPLDGTWEFTTGVPEFVVSIGLVVDSVAMLGVLYNPITEETFSGCVGAIPRSLLPSIGFSFSP